MSTLQEKAQHLMLGCNAMGWHGSAALVNDLLKQRAELLEALKGMVGCMEQENPLSYAENIRNAKEAITRAEAAE